MSRLTSSLIILDNSSDLSYLVSKVKNFSQYKIISFDFVTHESLLHLGLKHEKVEDYFEIGDYELIDNLAIEKSLSWYKQKDVSPYLQFEDLNLGWLLENELPQYFLKVIKNFLALIRVMHKEKPTHIITSDFTASMIKEIDKNNKITIQIYETKKIIPKELDRVSFPLSVGKIQFTLWIPKKFAIKCAKFTEKIISGIFNFKFNLNDKKTKEIILLLNINPNPYELFLLNISHLDKDIVLLYDHGSAVWNLRNLRIVRSSGLKILQLDDLMSSDLHSKITEYKNILGKNLEKILSENSLYEFFSIETYSFWPSIKQEFISLCLQRFKEEIKIFELVKIMFSKMKIKSVIYLYNPNPLEKIISHLAQKSEIPGFVLQHGYYILGNHTKKILRILFPALQKSLKHLLWGKEMSDFLSESKNLEGSEMILSGNPRYDQYFKLKLNSVSQGTLLLASSFLQNTYEVSSFDTDLTMLHKNMFREICSILNNIKGKKLVIKLHPGAKPTYDVQSILQTINPNIPIYRTQYILDLLKDCDVLVSMDHSTVLLEAMILEKPTIIFTINPKWYEDDAIIRNGATILVSTPSEFEIVIKKILFNIKFRNDLIAKGTKFVNSYLSNQGNSSEFVANLIEKS